MVNDIFMGLRSITFEKQLTVSINVINIIYTWLCKLLLAPVTCNQVRPF